MSTELQVINNSIEIFKSAPDVLLANQERTRKALQVGQSILSQWQEAFQIGDEEERLQVLQVVDERSNKFLVNCNNALKEQKELRASITQMMDNFKKMFTSAENDIDKTKAGSVPEQVQKNRDKYAHITHQIAERKRIEAEREAAKKQELINLKSKIEVSISNQFNDYLLKVKQRFVDNFNALKLDTFADDAHAIRIYEPNYSEAAFQKLQPENIYLVNVTKEEYAGIVSEIKSNLFDGFKKDYTSQLTELKNDIVDKLKSKFDELTEERRIEVEAMEERKRQEEAERKRQEEIARANEAERKRLEAEAAEAKAKEAERLKELEAERKRQEDEKKKREEEERKRMEAEAAEARAKAEQEAEIKKQGEQTMLMFEQEAAMAEVKTADARQGYEISVKHPAGYVQIFQYWFENAGKNLAIDKIGNTKLDQMKAFCEKQAHKTDEKIESKFIEYKPTFKAVNKK